MKLLLRVVLVLAAGPALAGQISGTIREGAKPVVGVPIVVKCGVEMAQAVTDKRGRYRVLINSNGNCRFEVPSRNASTWVESSSQPVRQDFSLSDNHLQAR
jgi:hypothetical protein